MHISMQLHECTSLNGDSQSCHLDYKFVWRCSVADFQQLKSWVGKILPRQYTDGQIKVVLLDSRAKLFLLVGMDLQWDHLIRLS